ncbi:MAG: hypothetical protein WDA42_08175 [Candidatus Bathyarchaeia archaeon]
MANQEQSAKNNTCVICDTTPVIYQWSDYHGEAMCSRCGCPYQLKGGSKEQEAEGKYPYLNLREDFLPIAREYWEETKKFVCYGLMLGRAPGRAEFNEWYEENKEV